MLNILSLLGPSRSGKGAIIPIIAAVKNFELPFNTPDLDWYVDAYNHGELSSDVLSRLATNYLLCYSWYGHLGRHINLRPDDYYSLQRMMPHLNLEEKHSRKDKDAEFINFLEKNDHKKTWNIFQWDLAPEIYEKIESRYPIRTNPIYCYRSPYYLFTSWLSSNRVKRSISLSRMFKYDATFHFKRESLLSQFENAKNDNEVDYIKELGTYKYKEFNFEQTKINQTEEKRLIRLIKENNDNAEYWKSKDMLYKFENIVSKPKGFVDYLIERFDISFDLKKLEEGIILMDQREVTEILELDLRKIKETLKMLGCSNNTIDFVVQEQSLYIEEFI